METTRGKWILRLFGRYIKQVPEENALKYSKKCHAVQCGVYEKTYTGWLEPSVMPMINGLSKKSGYTSWIRREFLLTDYCELVEEIKRLLVWDLNKTIILSLPNQWMNHRKHYFEYEAVRNNTLALVENLPESAWDEMGTASNNLISAQAFAFYHCRPWKTSLNGIEENYHLWSTAYAVHSYRFILFNKGGHAFNCCFKDQNEEFVHFGK